MGYLNRRENLPLPIDNDLLYTYNTRIKEPPCKEN